MLPRMRGTTRHRRCGCYSRCRCCCQCHCHRCHSPHTGPLRSPWPAPGVRCGDRGARRAHSALSAASACLAPRRRSCTCCILPRSYLRWVRGWLVVAVASHPGGGGGKAVGFLLPLLLLQAVRGQSRTQAIRGWPGPPTVNPPHAKSPAVHCKDRVLDSIILLIRISYNNKSAILALPTTSTRPKTHIHTPTRAINIHTHQPQTHTHRLAIGSNI